MSPGEESWGGVLGRRRRYGGRVSLAERPETARCGFCGRGPSEVRWLVAGLTAWICDECLRVCPDIIDEVDPSGHHAATEPTSASTEPVDDPVMADLVAAQTLATSGDRAGARAAFEQIWERLGPAGDPLHIVTLAHYLADLQDDPADELAWDLRALEAADGLTDERAQAYHATLAVRGFYPSLHLNLAADLDKLGRHAEACAQLDRAEAALPALSDDGYGRMIRGGIERLRARLDVATKGES